MDVSCDLEVDVNGEECFMVNKDIISYYSSRIRKLFSKSKGATKTFKVIFHDFPGGAYGFELMTRFCYNRGKIDISISNNIILYCVASFMEMNQSVSRGESLLQLTEKSTKMISYWAWSDLMIALKQCQDLLPVSSSCGIINKCLDCVIARIVSSSEPSPCPSSSSPDSSGFRFSFESRSSESLKNSSPRATWWFEDFVVLEPPLIDLLVRSMVNRTVDHGIISRFLFYYQKARFVVATTDEKSHIMETVVALLASLEQSAVQYNKLFGIMRSSANLRLSSDCKTKLESMIGSQLDQASLDNLLIPSSVGSKSLYNVNLVLRFLKSFVGKEPNKLQLSRLQRVARNIDLYLAEVAPDPCLKPAKFLYLLRALPDSARDSYDGIYHAIDMYLKVHSGLSQDEKISICCALNFEKLSSDICEQLTHNSKFPSQSVKLALLSQQSRLKSLLLRDSLQPEEFLEPECSLLERESSRREASSSKQIVLYASDVNLPSENEKLKANLQGMQCRVMELEKICRNMQIQMSKVMKARLSTHKKSKSLPKLCS